MLPKAIYLVKCHCFDGQRASRWVHLLKQSQITSRRSLFLLFACYLFTKFGLAPWQDFRMVSFVLQVWQDSTLIHDFGNSSWRNNITIRTISSWSFPSFLTVVKNDLCASIMIHNVRNRDLQLKMLNASAIKQSNNRWVVICFPSWHEHKNCCVIGWDL